MHNEILLRSERHTICSYVDENGGDNADRGQPCIGQIENYLCNVWDVHKYTFYYFKMNIF